MIADTSNVTPSKTRRRTLRAHDLPRTRPLKKARVQSDHTHECRGARRCRHLLAVKLFDRSGSLLARGLDVSRTGMRVSTERPIERQPLSLIAELEPGLRVRLKARPIWQDQTGSKTIVGLQFFQTPGCSVLNNWLERILS